MDDAMIDQMTGDALLRRRLDAYAEARLSPDLAASTRIRARVLAVAHRRADLARADAALVVLSPAADPDREVDASTRTHRAGWRVARRVAPALLAASAIIALAAGSALAAAPGGPLYATRLWVETLTLPSEPSARAVAELARLESRLEELAAANRVGDGPAFLAALDAYEAILRDASTEAILARDAVAAAALETGFAQNISVLQALAATVPDRAGAAISSAIDRAIDRSDAAIEAIDGDKGHSVDDTPGGAGGADDGAGGKGGGPAGTPEPTPTKEPKPTAAAPVAEPTDPPKPKPTKEPKPTAAAPVAEPTRTPRPDKPPAPSPPGKPAPGGD